jgi:hypothetical protein
VLRAAANGNLDLLVYLRTRSKARMSDPHLVHRSTVLHYLLDHEGPVDPHATQARAAPAATVDPWPRLRQIAAIDPEVRGNEPSARA